MNVWLIQYLTLCAVVQWTQDTSSSRWCPRPRSSIFLFTSWIKIKVKLKCRRSGSFTSLSCRCLLSSSPGPPGAPRLCWTVVSAFLFLLSVELCGPWPPASVHFIYSLFIALCRAGRIRRHWLRGRRGAAQVGCHGHSNIHSWVVLLQNQWKWFLFCFGGRVVGNLFLEIKSL